MPPPLTPRAHGFIEWPDNAEVYTVFYDSSGSTIATIDGAVTDSGITFDVDPEDVDMIPAGAGFETFLVDGQGRPFKLRYGQVIRKEATFFTPLARSSKALALQFSDNFSTRTGLVGSRWEILDGRPTIFDNSDDEDPNAVGPNGIFGSRAAMRFQSELNTDSWLMSVRLLNPGAGKTIIAGGCNATMTTGLFVQFESGTLSNYIHVGTGSGPYTMTDQIADVAHTVTNNTVYKIRYDDDTKVFSVLNSDMSTTLASWEDEAGIVPKGQGYRHFAASWQASLTSSGIQLVSISVQDGLNV
jgi:hypothetical protein